MLRLAFDFIITWRETRTRPNAYGEATMNIGSLRAYVLYLLSHLTLGLFPVMILLIDSSV